MHQVSRQDHWHHGHHGADFRHRGGADDFRAPQAHQYPRPHSYQPIQQRERGHPGKGVADDGAQSGASVVDILQYPGSGRRVHEVADDSCSENTNPDDELVNLDIIDKILQQANHKTFTAESGEEALKILENESAKIDLILLDLIMPKVNGMDLLKKLKDDNNTYHIPVIMLSAFDDIDTIVECISMGADDFLIKPVNRILLNARLNNSLEKKYLSI